MTLPERLAALRLRVGISAAALSDIAGLSPAHVAMIESGGRPNLAASTALALARALGTTFEHLVSGEGVEPTDEEVKAAIERARAARSNGGAAVEAAASQRKHPRRTTTTATDHSHADHVRVDRDPDFDQRPAIARGAR